VYGRFETFLHIIMNIVFLNYYINIIIIIKEI